jgi:WD40 repeat protein
VVTRDGPAPAAVGGPTNSGEPVCFAPDGKVLAVLTDASAVQLRDLATGKDVCPLEAHEDPVLDLAFTPQGGALVSRGRAGVLAWDLQTSRLLHRLPPDEQGGEWIVALLPDGRLLTADPTADPRQGLFRLRDARTGREVFRFEGRPDVGPPCAVAAPGGRYAALRGRAGEVCVIDLQAGRCLYRLDPAEAASGLRVSADGDVLVWHRRVPKGLEVRVHRHAAGTTLGLGAIPESDTLARWLDNVPCVSPDGRWLVADDGRGLRRWDLATGKELPRLPEAQRTVWGLFWSPDGRQVAARGSAAEPNVIDAEARQDLRLWDMASGRRLPHLELPYAPQEVLFTADGRTLLTTDREKGIRLWEVATGQERRRLAGHLLGPGPIDALALGPGGRTLASGGSDGQVLVWDLTGRMPDGRWRPARLPPQQLRAAWDALSGDAPAAYTALWTLAADPEGATALLRERLRPVERPDPARLRRLLTGLDDDAFEVRQRVERELEIQGDAAAAELRRALAGTTSAEAGRRLRRLLEGLDKAVPAGERLRAVRAVEALELIDTPQSREVLRHLAGGAPEARLTREAEASLRRLGQANP